MLLCAFTLWVSRVEGGDPLEAIGMMQRSELCDLGQCGGDGGGGKVIRVWIYLEDRACGN